MAASLLLNILITFLVIILIVYLVERLPLDQKIRRMVQVIVLLIGILSLFRFLVAI